MRVGRGGHEARPHQDARRALHLGNPDRHQATFAHQRRGGHQPVRVFPRAEREREVESGQALVERGAAVAVDPARQVNGDSQGMMPREACEERGVFRREWARETAAEQRVDEHAAVSGLGDRAAVGPSGGGSSLGSRLERGDHRDLGPAAGEFARDHIAVAAVVAGAAQDGNGAPGSDPPDPVGRACAGALHQAFDALAVVDQRLLGRAHLRDGEDLRAMRHCPAGSRRAGSGRSRSSPRECFRCAARWRATRRRLRRASRRRARRTGGSRRRRGG